MYFKEQETRLEKTVLLATLHGATDTSLCGQKAQYQKSGLKMIEEFEKETKGLLSGRYYFIIVPTENGFQTRIYDTTGGLTDEYGYPHAGEVVMEGIMSLIHEDMELLLSAGTAAMETKKVFNLINTETTDKGVKYEAVDNVIKFDFGDKS